MRTSKYSEEQIIGFLRQVEAGMPVKRDAVSSMVSDHQLSERHAYALVGLSRDAYRNVT